MGIKETIVEACNNDLITANEAINLFSIVTESEVSKVDKDFKPKESMKLSSFHKIHITESVIEEYKSRYPDLNHVRCKDTDTYKCDGYMWMDGEKFSMSCGIMSIPR